MFAARLSEVRAAAAFAADRFGDWLDPFAGLSFLSCRSRLMPQTIVTLPSSLPLIKQIALDGVFLRIVSISSRNPWVSAPGASAMTTVVRVIVVASAMSFSTLKASLGAAGELLFQVLDFLGQRATRLGPRWCSCAGRSRPLARPIPLGASVSSAARPSRRGSAVCRWRPTLRR